MKKDLWFTPAQFREYLGNRAALKAWIESRKGTLIILTVMSVVLGGVW